MVNGSLRLYNQRISCSKGKRLSFSSLSSLASSRLPGSCITVAFSGVTGFDGLPDINCIDKATHKTSIGKKTTAVCNELLFNDFIR